MGECRNPDCHGCVIKISNSSKFKITCAYLCFRGKIMSNQSNHYYRHPSINGGQSQDISYAQLKWNIQGLYDKIGGLIHSLENRRKDVPQNKTSELNKVDRWLEQLGDIKRKIENIRSSKLCDIEIELDYEFKTPEG